MESIDERIRQEVIRMGTMAILPTSLPMIKQMRQRQARAYEVTTSWYLQRNSKEITEVQRGLALPAKKMLLELSCADFGWAWGVAALSEVSEIIEGVREVETLGGEEVLPQIIRWIRETSFSSTPKEGPVGSDPEGAMNYFMETVKTFAERVKVNTCVGLALEDGQEDPESASNLEEFIRRMKEVLAAEAK